MPLVVVADSGRVARWIATECRLSDQKMKSSKMSFNAGLSERIKLNSEIEKQYPNKSQTILELLRRIAVERRYYVS